MSSEAPAERPSSSSALLRHHECCGSCLKHDGSQRCPECGRGEGHDQDGHTGPVDGRGEGHTGPVDGRSEGHNGPADLPEMPYVQSPAHGAEVSLGAAQGFPFPLCSQCGLSFDGEEHRPLLLPCGDVFCKKCLNEQEDADNQLCKLCNKSWSHSNIPQLPVVLDLESGGTGAAGGKGRKVSMLPFPATVAVNTAGVFLRVSPCFPSCNSCRRKYNPSSYRPCLVLCGHCFCRSCLELLRDSCNRVSSIPLMLTVRVISPQTATTMAPGATMNPPTIPGPTDLEEGLKYWHPRRRALKLRTAARCVFSGGSSECGWSPECEGSSEIIDQMSCRARRSTQVLWLLSLLLLGSALFPVDLCSSRQVYRYGVPNE